ncbi:hypothetical protein PHBOTO_000962 [Pseudozyma hubeiensis]|nr:hypothetical protein PHBOTO_000962 [Pseudozyma hubeiensis]
MTGIFPTSDNADVDKPNVNAVQQYSVAKWLSCCRCSILRWPSLILEDPSRARRLCSLVEAQLSLAAAVPPFSNSQPPLRSLRRVLPPNFLFLFLTFSGNFAGEAWSGSFRDRKTSEAYRTSTDSYAIALLLAVPNCFATTIVLT